MQSQRIPQASGSAPHRLPPSRTTQPRPSLRVPPKDHHPHAWQAQCLGPASVTSSCSAASQPGLRGRCRRPAHNPPSCFADSDQPSELATAPSALDLPTHRLQAQASHVQAAPVRVYAQRRRPPTPAAALTGQQQRSTQAAMGAQTRCFKCGAAGHWAQQCTLQQPQPVSVPMAPAAGASAAALPGSCYRCGQPGHWASSCPQPAAAPQRRAGPSSPPAAGPPAFPAAALPGTCFRCGRPGHWVKDCPEAAEPAPPPAASAPDPAPLPHLASLFPSSPELLLPSRQPGYLRHHLRADQRSQDWLSARDTRLTASAVIKAVGINPSKWGSNGAAQRRSLFHEKLGITQVKMNAAMQHGINNEARAVQEYRRLTGSTVAACDFVTYQQVPEAEASLQLPDGRMYGPGDAWIGGSPDGLILGSEAAVQALHRLMAAGEQGEGGPGCGPLDLDSTPSKELATLMDKAGILEIKCPVVTPGTGDAEKNCKYLFQIQALMEILDLGWADLFVYSTTQEVLQVRIERDMAFWAELLPHISGFWWEHIVPARRALELRRQGAGRELSAEEQKAAVAEFLPSALPGGATARLGDWARDMYERADKDLQLIM